MQMSRSSASRGSSQGFSASISQESDKVHVRLVSSASYRTLGGGLHQTTFVTESTYDMVNYKGLLECF